MGKKKRLQTHLLLQYLDYPLCHFGAFIKISEAYEEKFYFKFSKRPFNHYETSNNYSVPKPKKRTVKSCIIFNQFLIIISDYKLFAHTFNYCFKQGLLQIICETQSGFIKGLSIHNNIHSIQNLIPYSDRIWGIGSMALMPLL